MLELWETINSIESFDGFVDWYETQALGWRIFLGAAAVAICYTVLMMIFTLVPFGKD